MGCIHRHTMKRSLKTYARKPATPPQEKQDQHYGAGIRPLEKNQKHTHEETKPDTFTTITSDSNLAPNSETGALLVAIRSNEPPPDSAVTRTYTASPRRRNNEELEKGKIELTINPKSRLHQHGPHHNTASRLQMKLNHHRAANLRESRRRGQTTKPNQRLKQSGRAREDRRSKRAD
ncbi:hypothetical protein Bca52824_034786 [Brassica carinata]|uniref:Uncharacterized protein n=1 Tax=Brassica carinata TaxID=52824 RepID=A0A8X7S6F8_BRACI|nr:hypothetical protein Bca52824_034786 [Brassica carinata]